MTELPPLLRDQRKIDAQHLKLLQVFHFVLAGLACAGLIFLLVGYTFMISELRPERLAAPTPGKPAPAEIVRIMKVLWFVFFFVCLAHGLGNLISGLSIRIRKRRTFSLAVAGLNCLWMPFGTLLGVFTFVVLLRDSVRELYDAYRTRHSIKRTE